METLLIILTCLLGVSEGLALMPSVKANGVFDMIVKVMGMVRDAISNK